MFDVVFQKYAPWHDCVFTYRSYEHLSNGVSMSWALVLKEDRFVK